MEVVQRASQTRFSHVELRDDEVDMNAQSYLSEWRKHYLAS